jgi:hypothetical protein
LSGWQCAVRHQEIPLNYWNPAAAHIKAPVFDKIRYQKQKVKYVSLLSGKAPIAGLAAVAKRPDSIALHGRWFNLRGGIFPFYFQGYAA